MRPRGITTALAGAVLLLLGALVLPAPAGAGTSLSVGAPGRGTWQIGQMWHGPELSGLVPAGTAIDLSPVDGSPLDVYAVAPGRIVGTCVSPTQTSVFVDSTGIGVIGYVHLATGSVLSSGYVARGQRLGRLATEYVRSSCATSWTGPHLHLAFPSTYDVLRLAGQPTSRLALLQLPDPTPPTRFTGHPSSTLTLSRTSARVRVCADNLAGNVVHVRLSRAATPSRPGATRNATRLATGRCVLVDGLDGPGDIAPRAVYVQRSALNRAPSSAWKAPGCFRATGRLGLCDRSLLNKRQ